MIPDPSDKTSASQYRQLQFQKQSGAFNILKQPRAASLRRKAIASAPSDASD
jgi:hypothetical protein